MAKRSGSKRIVASETFQTSSSEQLGGKLSGGGEIRLRPGSRAYDIVYRNILARDYKPGVIPFCKRCGSRGETKKRHPLTIHHKDHDRNNWLLENLELCCRSCNTADGNRWRKNSGVHRDGRGTNREDDSWAEPSSREMEKSEEKRPLYTSALLTELSQRGWIPFSDKYYDIPDAIYSLAKRIKVSSNTTRRWLREDVSFDGPYEKFKITFRGCQIWAVRLRAQVLDDSLSGAETLMPSARKVELCKRCKLEPSVRPDPKSRLPVCEGCYQKIVDYEREQAQSEAAGGRR